MTITKEEVVQVAHLARLDVDEASIDALAGQIAQILEYVDTLRQVDTEGIPPTAHALAVVNAFREDAPAGHLPNDQALANAPAGEDGMFVVPKIIE